ncbi:MAG: hypothetical protein WC602_06195, partial [archaeon]
MPKFFGKSGSLSPAEIIKLRRKRKAEKRAKREFHGKKAELLSAFIKRFPLVKAPSIHQELIEARIHTALASNSKLKIIVFWGGSKEGPNPNAGNSELKALSEINWFANELGIYGVKFEVRLLFMDSYARRLNNEPEEKIRAYRESLRPALKEHEFELDSLDGIYRRFGGPESPKKSPSERKWKENAARVLERIKSDPETVSMLSSLARKHSPNANVDEIIKNYVSLHAFDDYLLERVFPNAIYVSFGNPKSQKAISGLPT